MAKPKNDIPDLKKEVSRWTATVLNKGVLPSAEDVVRELQFKGPSWTGLYSNSWQIEISGKKSTGTRRRGEAKPIKSPKINARNLRGTAILYADKVTGSMQRAIDETNRRREIQEKFNSENNITPKSISTKVKDIMEGARIIKGNTKKKKEDIEKIVPFKILDDSVENITETLQKLEDEMFGLAKKMEFEKAAVCRDKITSLKRKLIDL